MISETVNAFLETLDMEHLADRLAGGYSGGNKRKLSMAIAMLGNPPLVFLDGIFFFKNSILYYSMILTFVQNLPPVWILCRRD